MEEQEIDEVEKVVKLYESWGVKDYQVGYVYILKAENGLYKIGKSRSPQIRIGQIITASPVKITPCLVYKSTEYHKMERVLHEVFADEREIGEWFRLTDEDFECLFHMSGDHLLFPCYL